MSRGFPKASVHDVWRIDFNIAGLFLPFTHVVDEFQKQRPSLGVPEHRTRRFIREVEEIELAPKFAMIALLRFFKPVKVSVKFFFVAPCCAVDALQHFVVRVTSPVGTRQLHQLEGLG